MIERGIITKIKPFLETNDILLFYGARQVGKTTLMKIIQERYLTKKSFFFDLENKAYLELCNQNPDIFLKYLKSYFGWDGQEEIVLFIDEIQYLDSPTNFLKYLYDNYPMLKLIVSGSSTLEIRGKLGDSLVGRLIKFEIFPLSFQEFLLFKDQPNLAKLVGTPIDLQLINDQINFFYQEYIRFWAYPKVVLAKTPEIKKEYLKQIYTTYVEKDIKDIGKIRELEKFNLLIKLLAHQTGNLVNLSEISNTINITTQTLNERLFLLEHTFVIKLLTPFSSNLRGELTKMPKVFFIDNGLRNACDKGFDFLEGKSFENSFFNYIQNGYKAEKLNFYRTQDKKEIDFIIDWIPYEVKLAYNGKNLTALNFFTQKYQQQGTVITLQKPENSKHTVLFPREI